MSVQRPDLVRASPPEAERQASIVFRAALLITLILAVAMIALAPFLCVTLFGESFRGSVEMLRVLALGAFGIVALKLLGNALTAQRKPLLETAAVSGAFACTVALDVILIPSHGGLGAAVASSVAYVLGGVLVSLIFTRALKGRLRDLVPRGSDLVWVWLRARAGFQAAGTPLRGISADSPARDPAPTRAGDRGDDRPAGVRARRRRTVGETLAERCPSRLDRSLYAGSPSATWRRSGRAASPLRCSPQSARTEPPDRRSSRRDGRAAVPPIRSINAERRAE